MVLVAASLVEIRTEAKKRKGLCAWETISNSGSITNLTVKEEDVKKRIAQWKDDGQIGGSSVVVTCDDAVTTILDTGEERAGPQPFPKNSSSRKEGDCGAVFHTPSSSSNYSTPITSAIVPTAMARLQEALQTMLGKVGSHKVTCGQYQTWMVSIKSLAKRVPEVFAETAGVKHSQPPERVRAEPLQNKTEEAEKEKAPGTEKAEKDATPEEE